LLENCLKSYKAKWGNSRRDAYILYAGWMKIGDASLANEGMIEAEDMVIQQMI